MDGPLQLLPPVVARVHVACSDGASRPTTIVGLFQVFAAIDGPLQLQPLVGRVQPALHLMVVVFICNLLGSWTRGMLRAGA